MNIRSNPDTTLPAVTTGPLPSSRKIFVTPDEAPDLRVPLREIILSEGAGEPNLPVYDTSGPYTDPSVTIDVNKGLPRLRTAWVLERGGVEEYEGREIKPEDNGNVGAAHAAKSFTAHHRPLRGLSVPSPLVGEGKGGGSTRAVSAGATPLPNPPPQGGREQTSASGNPPMITQLEFARAGIITNEMI
ncbi:MAG: phosphomethylpyrimidine synthase, partial [Bradyrhizobium sp.]